MNTSDSAKEVAAVAVRFTDSMVYIALSDGREIGVPLARYAFLAQATQEQLSHWQIEPGGFVVYWPKLDDGLEVVHLLSPLAVA
ncbi:MAG: DUF2442 domain-containing protein [Chloroflexi bacterium]|nr:DUF2442 domain-containing protein [Chloroflexota bacterium]